MAVYAGSSDVCSNGHQGSWVVHGPDLSSFVEPRPAEPVNREGDFAKFVEPHFEEQVNRGFLYGQS